MPFMVRGFLVRIRDRVFVGPKKKTKGKIFKKNFIPHP